MPAGRDLLRRRLVLRRHAAHRIGDAAVDQLEAVTGAGVILAAGEPELEQRCIEQIAGIIAGDRPAGAIGAAQSRCEANDEEARVGWPERFDRRVEPLRFLRTPSFAENDEARAARAIATGRGIW